MIVKAGTEIHAIFPDNAGCQIMAFLISVSRFMLLESFFGSFAGHPHIQALQHTIELRIRGPEFGVFREDALR